MASLQDLLQCIRELPIDRPLQILNLSGDHERMIERGGLRETMPDNVRLLAGPGCAASICPAADVYQAIQLARRDRVTLLIDIGLLRLPVGSHLSGAQTLLQAREEGADIRVVTAPIEACMIARAEPDREVVLFCSGFETLFAPLAGLVAEGLPDNLSLLLCGRRVEPLMEHLLGSDGLQVDGLILPGNRCALTGTEAWDDLTRSFGIPAVVSGYTGLGLLTAIHVLLQQCLSEHSGVTNLYRPMVRRQGNLLARDRLNQVFDRVDGEWRGLGRFDDSAFRLRESFAQSDANRLFTDYRREIVSDSRETPTGCECPSVVMGKKAPVDCSRFATGCNPDNPHGACMASLSGTCYLRGQDTPLS